MPWVSGLVNTNPALNTILVDTGQLPIVGTYELFIYVASTLAIQLVLEQRDAANGANVQAQMFPSTQPFPWLRAIDVPVANQRFRVRTNSTLALASGTVQASIFYRLRPAHDI